MDRTIPEYIDEYPLWLLGIINKGIDRMNKPLIDKIYNHIRIRTKCWYWFLMWDLKLSYEDFKYIIHIMERKALVFQSSKNIWRVI